MHGDSVVMRAHKPVERYSVKLRKGAYIDLFLYKADEPEKGSLSSYCSIKMARVVVFS